jgi:hypothetical protein
LNETHSLLSYQVSGLFFQYTHSSTHLKSCLLTSPLCRKSEYIAACPSESFSLLRLWFIVNNPDAVFVPELVSLETAAASYALDFIDIDMWQQTSFEKEIINMVL